DWGRLKDVSPSPVGELFYRSDELKSVGHSWQIAGPAAGRYTYLLVAKDRTLEEGTLFFAKGRVLEGGFTAGLLSDERWVGFVNVNTPGPFVAVVAVPRRGTFRL